MRKDQALALAEIKIKVLEERLRLDRIARYGKRSETLSDLQLQLLDLEPGVSSEEVEAESEREPLKEPPVQDNTSSRKPRRKHPGRQELPAHLERVAVIVACTPEQCNCGKCGKQTTVIGYEETEVLAGTYIQADETPIGVQTHDKRGRNHQAYMWQYGSPGKGVVFDFRMGRDGGGPKQFLGNFNGLLQTDGYAGYNHAGGPKMVHACCLAHAGAAGAAGPEGQEAQLEQGVEEPDRCRRADHEDEAWAHAPCS